MGRKVRHNFVTNDKNIPNIGTHKNIKQMLIHIKGEVDSSSRRLLHFTSMDR